MPKPVYFELHFHVKAAIPFNAFQKDNFMSETSKVWIKLNIIKNGLRL